MEAAIKQQQYEVVGSKKGMKEDGEGEKMDNGSGNEGKLTKNENKMKEEMSESFL